MRWKKILDLVLQAAAALAVYGNTLDAGFVHDDRLQIEDNPWVKQMQHLPDLVLNPVWGFRTSAPSNFYRPTQMVVYNLIWAASGGNPLLFHLANALFHAMATAALAHFRVEGPWQGTTESSAVLVDLVRPREI